MTCSIAHSLAVVLLGPQKWRRQGVRPGHFDFESDLGLQLGPTNGTRESLAIEEPFKRSSGPLQKTTIITISKTEDRTSVILVTICFTDRKSAILGVWAAPGAPGTLPEGGGLRSPPFGRVSGAPGAPGAPGDPCKGWGVCPTLFGMLACIYALRTWTDTLAAKTCPYTLRSWTATLESSDRYRGTVDDNGTNFQQLASRTRALQHVAPRNKPAKRPPALRRYVDR